MFRRQVTPELLANARSISATAVLQNEVDLSRYPHRYLAVVGHGQAGKSLTQVLAAADHLNHFGWELVNVTAVNSNAIFHAILRRQ